MSQEVGGKRPSPRIAGVIVSGLPKAAVRCCVVFVHMGAIVVKQTRRPLGNLNVEFNHGWMRYASSTIIMSIDSVTERQ